MLLVVGQEAHASSSKEEDWCLGDKRRGHMLESIIYQWLEMVFTDQLWCLAVGG